MCCDCANERRETKGERQRPTTKGSCISEREGGGGRGKQVRERRQWRDCFQVPVPPPDIFLCVCQKKCGAERVHVGRCEMIMGRNVSVFRDD